ncbi:hypothetical protein ART_4359 [Arthrobacter sp. PAMC 25486]|nr:hypothetical protein ART_4359 [Arthrobacter sp. PAMC 25486]
MKAAYFTGRGGLDVIEYGNVPLPRPAPGTILVRVAASAVDNVDTFVRSGAYATELVFPQVLGRDLVGTVERLGSGTPEEYAGFAPGDPVWSNSMGFAGRPGAAAEFAAVPVERLYRLHAGTNPVAAAAVLHSGATAYLALHRHGQVQPGETVFIGGAGGGVGSAALSQAVSAGAMVVASSSAADLEYCRGLGAGAVLDYRSPDFADELRDTVDRVSGGRGVDVHLETSGRHQLDLALDVLGLRGRIVLMSGMSAKATIPLGRLYPHDISIRGFAISNATETDLAEASTTVNKLLAGGALAARSITTLPLQDAARAHSAMEAGTVHGKIVLLP